MTPKTDSIQASVPSLTMGNIITIGFQAFRLNFNDHFVRSLLSHLWIWAAIFGSIIIVGLALLAANVGLAGTLGYSSSIASFVGVVLGTAFALPLVLFPFARMAAVSGLMIRMGFNTVQRRVEPNELLRQIILRRLWAYLLAWVMFYLILLLVYGSFFGVGFYGYLLFAPLWQTLLAQLAGSQLRGTLVLVSFALGLIYVLGAAIVGSYLAARLSFFDAVLAIENHFSPIEALSRSWELTQGKGWSVLTIIFAVTLITLPILLLSTTINLFVPFVSLVTGVIMFPLWQAVKAVNFYDLATEKAGISFDLSITSADPRRFLRRVAMQTPEGVELDFALGGIGSRTIAWSIDQTIVYLGLLLLWLGGAWVYVYAVLPIFSAQFNSLLVDDLNLWAFAIAGLLSFTLTNGYFITWETLWRGQTPGKRLAKIRVVRDDGQPIGVKEAALRSFVGWFDLGFFFIGLILVLFGRSEKRLGDMAAGTLVIQEENSAQQQMATVPTVFSTLTKDTVEILNTQTDPTVLSVDHYFVLQNFLGHRSVLNSVDRKQVTAKLARQLRSLLLPNSPNQLGTIPDETLIEAAYLICRPSRDRF
jgi:uncharacterized RDD family membrane protein YckC